MLNQLYLKQSPSPLHPLQSTISFSSSVSFYINHQLPSPDNSTSYSKLKDFGDEVNYLFPNIIKMAFYCQTQTIDLMSHPRTQVIGIYNGTIIENKKMQKLTEEYIQYLMTAFELKPLFIDHVKRGKLNSHLLIANRTMTTIKSNEYALFLQKCCEDHDGDDDADADANDYDSINRHFHIKKKLLRQSSLTTSFNEIKSSIDNTTKISNKIDRPTNDQRISRLLWSLLIVLIVSIAIFFLVKYSIDWATSSKTEINKQKEQRLRDIAEFLTTKASRSDN